MRYLPEYMLVAFVVILLAIILWERLDSYKRKTRRGDSLRRKQERDQEIEQINKRCRENSDGFKSWLKKD